MRKKPTIVTQDEIDSVWGYADFGPCITRFNVVKYGLLKSAGGFYQGHTSTCILVDLGLITRTKKGDKLTIRGQRNLYEFFKDDKNNV